MKLIYFVFYLPMLYQRCLRIPKSSIEPYQSELLMVADTLYNRYQQPNPFGESRTLLIFPDSPSFKMSNGTRVDTSIFQKLPKHLNVNYIELGYGQACDPNHFNTILFNLREDDYIINLLYYACGHLDVRTWEHIKSEYLGDNWQIDYYRKDIY
jgi:hypothetical protein